MNLKSEYINDVVARYCGVNSWVQVTTASHLLSLTLGNSTTLVNLVSLL